jgi:putative photosynthetic complex assembly protein
MNSLPTESRHALPMTAARTSTPTLPLVACAVLALATLVGVSVVRLTGIGSGLSDVAPVVQARALRFEDRVDGGITVVDALNGAVIGDVAPGTNGFLRSAMRGLVRERKREGIGPQLPFELLIRSDQRLSLEDPGTGRRIDLRSFGPTNAGVFEQLLYVTSIATPGAAVKP